MNDRRIAAIACFMLVTLRLMIGWQLFYEGVWKINTLKTPRPWTAAGYLRNSQGPFRDMFRNLAGDPDDLDWLNTKKVSARWDAWEKQFVKQYDLNKSQEARLKNWINPRKEFAAEVPEIPNNYNNAVFTYELAQEVKDSFELPAKDKRDRELKFEKVKVQIDGRRTKDFDSADGKIVLKPKKPIKKGAKVEVLAGKKLMELGLDEVVRFRGGDKKLIVVDGRRHITPAEREKLITAFTDDGYENLIEPIRQAYKRSKDGISYKEKLKATINGNPDWVENEKLQRVGEIKKYKNMLAEYENDLKTADQPFEFDHLQHTWGKIQAQRSSLVGPVKALDKELRDKATEMLSTKQLSRGPVREPLTRLKISDLMTIAGLTILGACLMLGLFTRFSAVMAAVMLFMFYAAMPPWPGVPEQPGPEHSFIVNKNFIEVIALLGIACLPTGRWFGVDGMLGRWLGKRKLAKQAAKETAAAAT